LPRGGWGRGGRGHETQRLGGGRRGLIGGGRGWETQMGGGEKGIIGRGRGVGDNGRREGRGQIGGRGGGRETG